VTGSLVVRAPGKLFLCGEYAVLHGAPALCVAVNRHVTCTVTRAPGEGLEVCADGVTSQHGPRARPAGSLVDHVVEERRGRGVPGGVAVTVDTAPMRQDGQKLGLGSSAAVAVALTAALDLATCGGEVTPARRREWFDAAQRAHRRSQGGTGAGADVATSTWGGYLVYRRRGDDPRDAEVTPVTCGTPAFRWRAAWTGQAARTSDLVNLVDSWRVRAPGAAAALFRRMDQVAEAVAAGACRGDAPVLLQALHAYGGLLEELGEAAGAPVVDAAHRRIRDIASRHGGAAKPSGAGGGDAAVCFFPDPATEACAMAALLGEGFVPLELEVDRGGVTVARGLPGGGVP
jgi:phosphomevalonate kinase